MTTRRRHGEVGISFEHRSPCRDPRRHRGRPGLWRGEFTTGYTGDGKHTRRKFSGKTKAAVIDKLWDLHLRLDQGITPKPGYTHFAFVPSTPGSGKRADYPGLAGRAMMPCLS